MHSFSKGKARTLFEFGAKVGIAVTARGNLIDGARAYSGAPFDGHTLHEQILATEVWIANPNLTIVHRGKAKSLSEPERKLIKRRNAVEPVIGHLKADHRMDRRHLKGEIGDRLDAVRCAAGYNLRWLLRAITRKGLGLFLALAASAGLGNPAPLGRIVLTDQPRTSS